MGGRRPPTALEFTKLVRLCPHYIGFPVYDSGNFQIRERGRGDRGSKIDLDNFCRPSASWKPTFCRPSDLLDVLDVLDALYVLDLSDLSDLLYLPGRLHFLD